MVMGRSRVNPPRTAGRKSQKTNPKSQQTTNFQIPTRASPPTQLVLDPSPEDRRGDRGTYDRSAGLRVEFAYEYDDEYEKRIRIT